MHVIKLLMHNVFYSFLFEFWENKTQLKGDSGKDEDVYWGRCFSCPVLQQEAEYR